MPFKVAFICNPMRRFGLLTCIIWFSTNHYFVSFSCLHSLKWFCSPCPLFYCNLLLLENPRSIPTALTLFIKPPTRPSALFYFYLLRWGRVKSNYPLTSKSSGTDELSQDGAVDSRQRSIIERVYLRTCRLCAVTWQNETTGYLQVLACLQTWEHDM